MIAGRRRGNDRASDRVNGVRDALRARGLDMPDERIVEHPYRVIEGRKGLRALMSRRPQPTAMICGNDVLAFGALIEAQALGRRVPAICPLPVSTIWTGPRNCLRASPPWPCPPARLGRWRPIS